MILGLLVGLATVGNTNAQQSQSDLLLKKLVEKGVLTQKEAEQMRAEAEREQYTLWQQASDLPAWVTKMSMKGDLRLRTELLNSAGVYGAKPSRERFRYRLRYGIVATLNEDWLVGFRLASGSTSNPTSTNETMDDDAANDSLTIDQAYVAWMPSEAIRLTFGKMVNPLDVDNHVMDSDYTPEGLGFNYTRALGENHTFGMNIGAIIVDESSDDSSDAYAGLAQVTLDSELSSKLSSHIGVSTYSIFNKEAAKEAHAHRGNTATYSGSDQTLSYNYNPVIIDAALTYNLDSFPMWEGSFPVKLGGTYINNPAVTAKNEAYLLGITFGKAKKSGTWQFSWQFVEKQADSLYDNWSDSDFGAYGVGGDANSYKSGTDVRGHKVQLKYQINDSTQFSTAVYRTESISTNANQSTRAQFDLIWKF